MSLMIEVYCGLPVDSRREAKIEAMVTSLKGQLTFREGPEDDNDSKYVLLTFEFAEITNARQAYEQLSASGEHVEGISEYGD